MRRRARFVAAGIWILGALMFGPRGLEADAPAVEKVPKRIQVGAADWKPYFYGGRPDGPKGSAAEIFELCVTPLGYELVLVPASVEEVFTGLKDGRFHLHVLSLRPERQAYLEFGDEPMFYSGYRPFVRKGLKLVGSGPNSLGGLRLAHRRGMKYTAEFDAYISARRQEGNVLIVESDEEGLRAVAEGRVDAVPLMLSSALHHRRRLGLEDKVDVALDFDLKTAGYRVAVAKNQSVIENVPEFLAEVDACLRRIKDDGRYEEIGARYADLVD